jgi:hypothetical protein
LYQLDRPGWDFLECREQYRYLDIGEFGGVPELRDRDHRYRLDLLR